MKLIQQIFSAFYRIWFYLIVALATILLFPFLVISILKNSWYPFFFKVARAWSAIIIYGIGCYTIIKREVEYERGKSYMFVANHTSMTDIMLRFYPTGIGKDTIIRIYLQTHLYIS